MDDMWKNMKWVVCCLVTLLNTVYSDSEQSIGRIASTERNMVVVWDGSIQAQDFRRMGIHANADLYLVILTHGIDLPLEDADEDGRTLAYTKRRHVFELSRALNAKYSFLNLSLGADSALVLEKLSEKVMEYFPSKIFFFLPSGMEISVSFLRNGLNNSPAVRVHYALPLSALRREGGGGSAHAVWSFGLRYRQAQKNSVDSYAKFVKAIVKWISDDKVPQKEKIRTSFAAVKWIEDSMKRDTSRVFRALMTDKKWLFEELRSGWIGFDVECTLKDSAVTDIQATELKIGAFRNAGDSLYAVFPNYRDKWLVNARIRSSDYVHENSTVQLFTPQEVRYTVPTDGNFETEYFRYPFEIIFIRFDERAEYNCLVRKVFYVDFAPKITLAYSPSILLTSIDQTVEFTLTNYSHDPLADSIYVQDGVVSSIKKYFRLPIKYSQSTENLNLTWNQRIPRDEKFAHPVLIGGIRVGVIPSDVLTVSEQRSNLFLHSLLKKSSLRDTFTRTRYDFHPYLQREIVRTGDRILIDRNSPLNADQQKKLLEQVQGGAVVICLLEGNSWLRDLSKTMGIDWRMENRFFYEVRAIVDSTMFKGPTNYFANWLFHFTSYRVTNIKDSDVLIQDDHNDNPLVFSKEVGAGRIVFVNLALSTQLVNTNVNAMKLLFDLCNTTKPS